MFISAALGTFALVFVAELGDKTQLLVVYLSTRYRRTQVIAGVVLASAAVHLLSTAAGRLVAEYVSPRAVGIAAGLLFLAFGVWGLASARAGEGEERPPARDSRGAVAAVALPFFLAELGDKTQLVALSRAAQYTSAGGADRAAAFWGVWLGATAAMVAANVPAVLFGSYLGSRVRRRALAAVSGVVFLVFGAVTLAQAIW